MFKKSLILIASLSLLAACGNDEDAAGNKEVIENVKEAPSSGTSQERADETAVDDEIASLPEYQTIMKEIDKEDCTFKLLTDNEGKRVFLLTDETGKEEYKSIFIKETNRLKIIELESNREIFNDRI